MVAYSERMSTPRPGDMLIREQQNLQIVEATDGNDGIFNADGTVNMVIVRPCNGRGPGQAGMDETTARETVEVGR